MITQRTKSNPKFTFVLCALLAGCASLQDPAAAVQTARSAALDGEAAVSQACNVYVTALVAKAVKRNKVADDICAADAALHAP